MNKLLILACMVLLLIGVASATIILTPDGQAISSDGSQPTQIIGLSTTGEPYALSGKKPFQWLLLTPQGEPYLNPNRPVYWWW